jgi:benzoate-CoA ligase family protein
LEVTTETYNIVADLLDRHVRSGLGSREAIRCSGRTWTYRQLMDLVARAGSGLLDFGVEKGTRVLLLLQDSTEFAASYLAAMRVGAVAVPCNPGLKGPDFRYFLDESLAKVVVAHESVLSELLPVIKSRKRPPPLVVVGASDSPHIAWEDWVGESSPDCELAPTSPQDVAFWLWTSGSTGLPKAALHRHQDWKQCIDGYARGVLNTRPKDVAFSAAKSFHAYGLGNGLVFPLFHAARTVYYPGRPTAEAVLAVLREERPTLFFAVPTMYANILAHTERGAVPDLRSVRHCVSAGEPLPAELFRRWLDRFGLEILDGIGSTEVLHIYISARPGRVRPESTGEAVAGYALRIVGEDGKRVPRGAVGDLWVRGRSTAVGYWRRPDLTAQRMRGEWFVSGDKFYADADGYYWYIGRSDDMFKTSAEWVSPVLVESALVEHSSVLESGVVGSQDSDGLTKPRAYVVLKPGNEPSRALADELKELVRRRLPPYSIPEWIEFVAEIPKSATGKVLRFRLRERAETS